MTTTDNDADRHLLNMESSNAGGPSEPSALRRQFPRRGRGGKAKNTKPELSTNEGVGFSNSNQARAEGGRGQRPPRRGTPNRQPQPPSTADANPSAEPVSTQRPNRPRKQRNPQGNTSETNTQDKGSKPPPNRRGKFGGKLTEDDDGKDKSKEKKPAEKYRTANPLGDDLASTLIRSLSTAPYPDCPICFSSLNPSQAIWSCSPLIPVIPAEEGTEVQYCWTPFHVHCIKSWASKSVKDSAEAFRVRGEPERNGDWRCPGCQAKREVVPSGYRCFCGSMPEPKVARLSTPHSCGQPCSRVRDSGCGHPCPLLCHPGPCPPCQITSHFKCYCPRKSVLSFRCGVGKGKRDLSCGQVCGRSLNCGKHKCTAVCHDGKCVSCPVTEIAKCYCGKHEKEMLCGEGKAVECFVKDQAPWTGRYSCDDICERSFDCGFHKCQKLCHSPSPQPAPCPRSPSKVAYCPCGKKTITPPDGLESAQYDFPPRLNCQVPIPTCESQCSKPHPGCSHPCSVTCHIGPCPPCNIPITRPCRCGSTTRKIPCHEAYSTPTDASGTIVECDFLCDRPCPALRACGRHQCHRVCCPLASLAAITSKKGKKRAPDPSTQAIGTEGGGLHECDLVCGKMLSCGNHRCEEKDHKGPCPRCLMSSFEELFCACGRTVLEPPVPCGTKIQCSYPCNRPPPSCGHPKSIHACHDDSKPCPPCPFLTSKSCGCGKKTVDNVRCSLETDKVSCGTICGKLMPCGFHHCESLCHSGDCGACSASCGKLRKLCLPNHHPCTLPCHAPSTCSESEPCESITSVTCPCGRLKQAIQCGRQVYNPAGYRPAPLKCTTECSIAKRNMRLAEALGINPHDSKDKASYNDDTVAFARANMKFLPIVEKAFADFVASEKRHQVLPHMTPEKRKFVNDLSGVYRMDTQMVDQEPNRSVQLIRRIDTRVPTPLLSAHIASVTPVPNLGKLADLRGLKSGISASGSPSPSPAPGSSAGAWRNAASALPGPRSSSPINPTYVNVNSRSAAGSGGQATAGRGWTSVVRPTPAPAPGSFGPTAPTSSSSLGGIGVYRPPAALAAAATPPSRYQPSASRIPTPPPVVAPLTEDWEDDL